jgi:hypothetical protein
LKWAVAVAASAGDLGPFSDGFVAGEVEVGFGVWRTSSTGHCHLCIASRRLQHGAAAANMNNIFTSLSTSVLLSPVSVFSMFCAKIN